jgi:hypothetical protein
MDKAGAAAKTAVDTFISKHGMGNGYCGYANAMTYEVTNSLVQYMLEKDLASGPFDGRVWINFPRLTQPHSQWITTKQAVALPSKCFPRRLALRCIANPTLTDQSGAFSALGLRSGNAVA